MRDCGVQSLSLLYMARWQQKSEVLLLLVILKLTPVSCKLSDGCITSDASYGQKRWSGYSNLLVRLMCKIAAFLASWQSEEHGNDVHQDLCVAIISYNDVMPLPFLIFENQQSYCTWPQDVTCQQIVTTDHFRQLNSLFSCLQLRVVYQQQMHKQMKFPGSAVHSPPFISSSLQMDVC